MEQTAALLRSRRSILAIPGVETNVMVISPSGDKYSLRPITLHFLESENVPIETKCSLKVRHFEVDMTDVRLLGNFVTHRFIFDVRRKVPTLKDANANDIQN